MTHEVCFKLGITYQDTKYQIDSLYDKYKSVLLLDLAEKALHLKEETERIKFPTSPFENRDLVEFCQSLCSLTTRTQELIIEGTLPYFYAFELQIKAKFLKTRNLKTLPQI